ncbi:gas vesicle protein GvpG [Micromonospora sp. bgisy143]|uniref:gas vesicle protein GvpG n=1 Tax=Micromonospora sp. bgisy143 TaxID=3413790 RepID=UPI003EBDEA4A
MDLLWALLTLPYAPVRGLTAVVGVVAREAEARQRNPVNVRRELEELDAAVAAGELSVEERDRAEQRVLDRLTGGTGRRTGGPPPGTARSRGPGRERGVRHDRRRDGRRA